jgi:hypothetical protein
LFDPHHFRNLLSFAAVLSLKGGALYREVVGRVVYQLVVERDAARPKQGLVQLEQDPPFRSVEQRPQLELLDVVIEKNLRPPRELEEGAGGPVGKEQAGARVDQQVTLSLRKRRGSCFKFSGGGKEK